MTRVDEAIKMVEKLFPDSHAFSKRYVLSVLKEKMDTLTKCQWCYRMRKNCKIVQVIKWKTEKSKGLRNTCPECRKSLKGEIIDKCGQCSLKCEENARQKELSVENKKEKEEDLYERY